MYKVPDAAASVTEELRSDLFKDIVSRFLRIGDNQFRKDCIRKMGKKKTESLRKKVLVNQTQKKDEEKSGKKRKGVRGRTTGKGKSKKCKGKDVTFCGN